MPGIVKVGKAKEQDWPFWKQKAVVWKEVIWLRMIQPPLGLVKEQMETSITNAASKQHFFIPQGVVSCPHSPVGYIGFPTFKSSICKHP